MTVLIHGAELRLDRVDEQIEVRRIAWPQQIGLDALNAQHPAQLPRKVAVLAL